MTSGYTSCACRDCMDVTVSSDTSKPELCTECQEAGCEQCFAPDNCATGMDQHDCQRADAYGFVETEDHPFPVATWVSNSDL